MPILLLLNGPPGVGKSTLAASWAAASPRREVVDVDLLRAALTDPHTDAARLRARDEAAAVVCEHLDAGRSVVVPQLCAREDFPARLRRLAADRSATFVEVLLLDSLAHLRQRLAIRATSTEPHHALASAELTDKSLQAFRAALVERAGADPEITVVECPEGQHDITLRALEQLAPT